MLLSTVRRLLHSLHEHRQSFDRATSDAQTDAITLDQRQRQVFVQGVPVKLTNYEYRLLTFFLHNRGSLLTVKQILDHVWGWESAQQTRNVHTYIWRLRHKIEANPQQPTFLLNEYGIGYRFARN